MQGIDEVTFPAGTFDEEYMLPCDDKDFVTFHKTQNTPWIVDKLHICDEDTTDEPIFGDWYMTINYHS